MKKLIKVQFIILLLGTVFAWGNFGVEVVRWMNNAPASFSCALAGATNPFLTPCFYGALFFTAAFVLSVLLLKESAEKE